MFDVGFEGVVWFLVLRVSSFVLSFGVIVGGEKRCRRRFSCFGIAWVFGLSSVLSLGVLGVE